MTPQHIIIAVSALGGIIGGMGMGGGTLLIPLLTLAAGIEQHLAQAINLFAFVPMSIAALIVHKKNGYVCFKRALPIAGLALVGAVAGSVLTGFAGGYTLRACFGAFLILLGLWQLFKTGKQAMIKLKNKNKNKNSKSVATDM